MEETPDIGGMMDCIGKGDPGAKVELLELINALCREVDVAREGEHLARNDVRLRVYLPNFGRLPISGPLWASDIEANWELLREIVHKDSDADIGPWSYKRQLESIKQRTPDPAFYQGQGHDADQFA